MFFRILKKDIQKRRGINFILFPFITLATVFLASSVNNILVVSSAVDHYMGYAHVPDLNVVINSEKEKKQIDNWLDQQKKDGVLSTYAYNNLLILNEKAVEINKNGTWESFDTKGASLYLGTMDADYNQVFKEDGKTFSLKPGEIALSIALMEKNNLKTGDRILIQTGSKEKEFVIRVKMKDAAFGSDMIGMTRLIVGAEDYQELNLETSKLGLYHIMTADAATLEKKIENAGFETVINTIFRDMYKMVYSFDMIMSALLILVGVCLIFIALLVLRFTLIFTLEEQYQEIGVLKAIGFRNLAIKKIYLVKYFALVLVGSMVGLILSIPISNLMVGSVNKNMIMASSQTNLGSNIICACFIVLLVMAFCYFCTKKLNKVSAITAIRGGDTGERFHKKRGISLYKRKHMSIPFYLGLNDIFGFIKRYAVLMITFGISFVLITIPLNTINTIQSREMTSKFCLNPESAVYVRSIEQQTESKYKSVVELEKGMERLKKELTEHGYDVTLTGQAIYFLRYRAVDDPLKQRIMTIQWIGENPNFAEYSTGKAPILENEIAFSKTIMEQNHWAIGDTVIIILNGKEREMIITGTYSDYMQLGKSARLNTLINTENEVMFDYWSVNIGMKTDLSQLELAKQFAIQFPNYEWMSGQQLVDQNVGGIQNVLSQLLIPMTMMLTGVIMLITYLMEKLFIAREKGEIAILKSIGFRCRTIRKWQVIRMILVVFASFILAIPLSFLTNQFLLKPIFAIMGAEVAIQIDPLRVYFLYPGILLIGIFLATLLGSFDLRKINIREMNNLE